MKQPIKLAITLIIIFFGIVYCLYAQQNYAGVLIFTSGTGLLLYIIIKIRRRKKQKEE